MSDDKQGEEPQKQPIFNLPTIITGFIGLLLAIHVASALVLDDTGRTELVIWLGFIPARFATLGGTFDDWGPLLWTPITHALLHGGWEHLFFNMAWLAIFGTPVFRRYGAIPFLVIFFLSAIAGALFFAVTTYPDLHVLLGASGGISGLTGAAVRFMFQPVQVAKHPETGETIVLGRRLAGIGEMMRNPRPRTFVLIWVGINAITPLLPLLIGGEAFPIAWQAHLGGFFAGLFMVPLFERRQTKTDQP